MISRDKARNSSQRAKKALKGAQVASGTQKRAGYYSGVLTGLEMMNKTVT
jgi:hypothetical protein